MRQGIGIVYRLILIVPMEIAIEYNWGAIYRHSKNLTNILIIETRVDIHITVLKLFGNNKEIPFFAISPFDRGTELPCHTTM